jgi:hypothetical protein
MARLMRNTTRRNQLNSSRFALCVSTQTIKAQVLAQTIQNKKLEEKDPAIHRQHLDELRRTSEDITLHKKFLYRSSGGRMAETFS